MSIFINLSVLGTSLWQFIFSWWGVRVAYSLEAKEKHHLVALKIRLEAHILVLSVAAVAAEVAAAAEAVDTAAEAAAEAAAAAALSASDIPLGPLNIDRAT